jgi:hypothetical protein
MRKWSKPGLPFQPIGQGGDAIFDGTWAARRLGWLAMGGRALTFPAAILAEKIAL